MVIEACPDVVDYARGGIASWRDLLATMSVVRPVLGISPSAWDDACSVMGEHEAATVVAAMLQRSDAIASAGGYLRALTRKAEAGEFSTGPMLMALLAVRSRERTTCRLKRRAFPYATNRDRLQNQALQDVSSKHYDRWNFMAEKRAGMAKWDKFVRSMLGKKRIKMVA